MDNTNDKPSGKQKKIINVLIVLLILSLLGLVGRYIYLNYMRDNGSSTVTVPQNVIKDKNKTGSIVEVQGKKNAIADNTNDSRENNNQSSSDKKIQRGRVEAPLIELDKSQLEYNEKFNAFGMLPGDVVTKYYCVKVHHGYDVKVYFETEVTDETKHLGDVLKVKVTDVSNEENKETLVAEGPFTEINGKSYPVQLKENKDDYTKKYYRIDVFLDTSVGNPYQEATLTADFKWYVTDEEYHAMQEKDPIIPGITDPGKTDVPKTGDMFDKTLWMMLFGSALLLIIMSVATKRR